MLPAPNLDGDEVGVAFIGSGFGQQGLATARWSIEEDTLRGCHPKLKEFLGELIRILREGGGETGLYSHQY